MRVRRPITKEPLTRTRTPRSHRVRRADCVESRRRRSGTRGGARRPGYFGTTPPRVRRRDRRQRRDLRHFRECFERVLFLESTVAVSCRHSLRGRFRPAQFAARPAPPLPVPPRRSMKRRLAAEGRSMRRRLAGGRRRTKKRLQGVADYSEAIRLDPKFADAYQYPTSIRLKRFDLAWPTLAKPFGRGKNIESRNALASPAISTRPSPT